MSLSPAWVARLLVIATLSLTMAGAIVEFVPRIAGYPVFHEGIAQRFNLDGEANVPTWFSSSLLLGATLLLAAIASIKRTQRDRYAVHWLGLALLFLCMSLDETACLHEATLKPLRAVLPTGGLFYITYVIPGMIAVGIIAVTYLRFLIDLPRPTLRRFIVAGGLYIGAALGMEMLEGRYTQLYGEHTAILGIMTTIEECGEMLAVSFFIYALLMYVRAAEPALLLRLGEEHARAERTARAD